MALTLFIHWCFLQDISAIAMHILVFLQDIGDVAVHVLSGSPMESPRTSCSATGSSNPAMYQLASSPHGGTEAPYQS